MNEEPRMTLRVTEVMALQDRISALEATNVALVERQALLMNVVEKVYRWSDHVYGEGNAEDWYEIAMVRIQEMQRTLNDLTASGFPWVEEVTT